MRRRTSIPRNLFALCGLLVALTACAPVTLTLGGSPADNALRPQIVERADTSTRDRIAIIDVSGMIYNADRPQLFGSGENPVALLHERLEAARRDPHVKAVILRINSPGGTVTASDAMYREVCRFRQRSGKPVVALLMDVAASGGYYLACSADHIVAYPTSVTGSIGVMIQTLSLQPALGRLGITAEAITTGSNKAAGSLFAKLEPEQRAVFQTMIDDFFARFIAVVEQARPTVDLQAHPELIDGRIMSGTQAFQAGLVDELGDIADAAARARVLAGIEHANLLIYHRPLDYVGSPYAAAPATGPALTQVNIAPILLAESLGPGSAGFYYLWATPLR